MFPEPIDVTEYDDDFLEELDDTTSVVSASLVELVMDASSTRLDQWLASQLADRSRSEVQRWLTDGLVTSEGKVLKASNRLAQGVHITVAIPATESYSVEPEDIPLTIVYEDADMLVIDKPAGMVVHPAVGNWHGTLVNAVLFHCPGLEGVGGVSRPGIVHRLDKDTSGLIVVAKNDRSHRHLQNQFKERTVHKTYLAMTYGQITPRSGLISAPIGRDPSARKRMAARPAGKGRPAETTYEVQGYFGNYTLVACHPLTGRTHQIRVHMAHIRHPLVGDTVYAGKRKLPFPCARHFLHAAELTLHLPSTDEAVTFRSPLPADLQAFLDAVQPPE
jgi:23S rRNA pseudouridine1911/1915/1917 synthase